VDPDPYVFGPSGSGSFYHQATMGKKNLDFYCFVTFHDFLFLKNDGSLLSKSNEQTNLKVNDELAGSGAGSISQRHGSVDMDQY
jgi:hypothetical protein